MIRPLNDWMVVKMDPIPEKVGLLFTVHGDRVRTGTIVSVGPGACNPSTGKRIPLGVEKGEKIAFFRENFEHQQGKQLVATLKDLGNDLGMLRAADVLFVIAPGEEVRVSS